jgi:thiamine biosynthesis lipoprotein
MGTIVTISVVHDGFDHAVERAFQWFFEIEERCSRFDPRSELSQLTRQVGVAVQASDILYQSVQFALMVAEESGGAFDPTVGHRMEARGYNREYRTQELIQTPVATNGATFHDVELNAETKTITLKRPLLLDLGAVAKGLAIDTAARELKEVTEDFCIDAGGDLYLGGLNSQGEQWSVGIRHPRLDRQLIETMTASDEAVCTSGDYERGGHVLDPRSGEAAVQIASATVIAPSAMLADALATAAFVMGPEEGIALLRRLGVRGLMFTPELERFET